MKSTIKIALCLLCFCHEMISQQVSLNALPVYNKAAVAIKRDWLVSPPSQKSGVYRTPEGYLALTNGIITRTFTTTPNGATIALDNLLTNEALLRSVTPEAVVWINGQEISVGGLTGQPLQNYLLPEWLPAMKANPMSMKLTSWETSPIRARFEWNRRSHWTSQPSSWPPKGLELTFTYKADETVIDSYTNHPLSDRDRKVLLRDNFLQLSPDWKIVNGTTGDKLSFSNEGKPGEILGPPKTVVYAERSLPEETRVIICKLNSGTDLSTAFGPGISLSLPDRKNIKFYLSPGNRRFGVNNNGVLQDFPGFNPDKSWFLRMEFSGEKLHLAVSDNGDIYQTLHTLTLNKLPTHLRVGKSDPLGNNMSETDTGLPGRSKIEAVQILGDPSASAEKFRFLKDLTVKVHYELYDGLPLLSKWVTVENKASLAVVINNLKSENLAVVEAESAVEPMQRWTLPPIFAQSDFAFHSMSPNASENACIEWKTDPTYTTQVNYNLQTPVILECMPKNGIGQEVSAGKPFESMRLWELLYDSEDRERRGLSERKMYRTIAPWITENPMIMHVSSAKDDAVKKAIDQSAEVGFEMVIMTFGSGFSAEDTSSQNLDRLTKLREYATAKNIALGGYSLLASRSIDKQNDVVMPKADMKPVFGNSPCLGSVWGVQYFKKLYNLFEKTGLDLLEHDGSYPGDVCASNDHPGHTGLEDSQWKQFAKIRDFYVWARKKGIYLNVPDWYFLAGSNKIAMGYRETNWSLPRHHQEIIERQNIYDGTWQKTPSMGWMFVPLVQYHGGGAAATIEPLKDHLPHYEQRLANLFGAGVQACYRGPQLYDTQETKSLVMHWVDFYKKHRRILDADLIHIRRPDGRDYDALLHVDPVGPEKGLLMIYNPRNEAITRTLQIDLYYTGLKSTAQISEQDKGFKTVKLNGTKATIQVKIPAKSQSWYVFK